MSEVQDQLKLLLTTCIDEVVPEATMTLGADSLDTVELVMAFEEKFGIEILMMQLKQYKLFKMQ